MQAYAITDATGSPYRPRFRRFLLGLLAGLLLTAPLIVVFYLGHLAFALPLLPFNIFDWLARLLPGNVLTFGIENLVKLVNALHLGQTSAAAKAAEQSIAIVITLLAGIFSSGIFFLVRGDRRRPTPGLALAAIAGVPSAIISYAMTRQNGPVEAAGIIWILMLFTVWGLIVNWIYLRLFTGSASVATGAEVVRINRRQFMIKVGGAAAVITVAGAALGKLGRGSTAERHLEERRWSQTHALPNASAPVQPVEGTRPEFTPLEKHYRVDIDTIPPVVHETSWKLKVGGLVEQPRELVLDDLRKYPATDQFITLSCISNPIGGDLIGTQRWTSVSLQQLLPELRLKPSATHLKISSADGFFETIALSAIQADSRIMLAYAWDGVPLLPEHGFPLRIYIPDIYGMKQPKWIVSIDAIDHDEPGYWVVRGWDKKAEMRSTSVIDVVGKDQLVHHGGRTFVPLGGIAHGGARGISRVEISVDGGPWQAAELRTPISNLTWVLWRHQWPFSAGEHSFTVRCFDASGAPQIVEEQPPHPSGATGLYVIKATV